MSADTTPSDPLPALDRPIAAAAFGLFFVFALPIGGAILGLSFGTKGGSRTEGTEALALSLILMTLAYWAAKTHAPKHGSAILLTAMLALGSAWCAFQFGASLQPSHPATQYR